jgi:hypothetical protein
MALAPAVETDFSRLTLLLLLPGAGDRLPGDRLPSIASITTDKVL